MFVYELSGFGFESSCSHLNFRFRACFEQGVPWHSGNYGVWIHSETRTWHDKNIQCQLNFIKKQELLLTTQSRYSAVYVCACQLIKISDWHCSCFLFVSLFVCFWQIHFLFNHSDYCIVIYSFDYLLKIIKKYVFYRKSNFQRSTVSWKLFFSRFINVVMTAHVSSIRQEYGRIKISNNFTFGSGILQYAMSNSFYELTNSTNLRNGWANKVADHFNKSQA